MDNIEALRILHDVWGSMGTLSRNEAEMIEREKRHGETELATVARVAGVAYEVSNVAPFDGNSIRAISSRALAVAKRSIA